MLVSIVHFLNLLSFGFVASQPIFYLLALSRVSKDLKGPAYVEIRKLIDKSLQLSLRVVYYSALVTSLTMVILTMNNLTGILFITSLISFLCLVTDMYFMLKGNQPVNKAIGSWTVDNFPSDWKLYREKWLYYFRRRQVADLVGFASLLIGAAFQ